MKKLTSAELKAMWSVQETLEQNIEWSEERIKTYSEQETPSEWTNENIEFENNKIKFFKKAIEGLYT